MTTDPTAALARVQALVDGWARDFDADHEVRMGSVVDDLQAAIDGHAYRRRTLARRRRT